MRSGSIVAYTFEAAYHCPECTNERFGLNVELLSGKLIDREGNPVRPVYTWDYEGNESCDDCMEVID